MLNNTIVAWYTHVFSSTCSVALHAQLFDTVNGKYQKSKETATDSNYLKCHTLLAALHFPLETTSCSWKQNTKERYWGQQFRQMESDISVRPTEITRPVEVAFKAGPEYSGRTKSTWFVPFDVPTEIFGQG